jgi:hypothetical protein
VFGCRFIYQFLFLVSGTDLFAERGHVARTEAVP